MPAVAGDGSQKRSHIEPRTDEENKNDVETLKTIKVCEENMNEIKTKLTATMDYRLRMINVCEVDLRETFPYFFTDPTLVIVLFSVETFNAL